MLFLLSCLMSYEVEDKRGEVAIEQTRAIWYENFKAGHSSSVKIHSIVGTQGESHGSGNYFKIGKEKFILTAAHVVNDSAALFLLDKGEYVFLDVVYIDRYRDIAIVVPERDLRDAKAINYRANMQEDILGISVNYTGHPGELGKATFRGMIAQSGIGYAVLQSFAIPGSSGSVVFDNGGKIIGVVSAVSVGMYFPPIPQLDENVVYIQRVTGFDKKTIKELIKKWRIERASK